MSVGKKALARASAAIVTLVALVLTGCSAEDPAVAPGGFVQDLWVFDQIVAVNVDDEQVELTDAIVAHFRDAAPDTSVVLGKGVTFHEYAALQPTIIDTNVSSARARGDVSMTAGFIETTEGRKLSILATPHPHTRVPIYFKDVVKFDLTFLGDAIQPGDPLLYDYAFLQAIPTAEAAEAGLSSLELLRHRMKQKSVQYYGELVGGKPVALVYSQELGMVLQGSKWAAFPPKSQDMMEGFEAGAKECAKKTRGSPLECVENFMTEFIDGVSGSWKLIDEQLDYVETEVVEKRKEAAAERTRDERVKPATPEKKCPTPDDGDDADPSDGESGGSGGCTTPPDGGGSSGGGSSATVDGDPHFRTFDDRRFDMQGVGEYLASDHDGLSVQIRTASVGKNVSSLSAVALGFDNHTVMIEAAELHVDGKSVTDTVIEVGGARIVNKNHIVTVEFEDGQHLRVTNTWGWALDLQFWNPQPGPRTGLLGDADGDPLNDLVSRDGQVFGDEITFDELYQRYSESWRVSQKESLFHYAAGDDTETFTDRSKPSAPVSVATLPTSHRVQAERMCRAAGIADEDIFDNCVLDFALLGELDDARVPGQFGVFRSAVTADKVAAFLRGDVDTLGKRAPRPKTTTDRKPGGGTAPDNADPDEPDASFWHITGLQLLGDHEPRESLMCSPGGEPGPVWGGSTTSYAMDSSVCTAAVHSGIITQEKGGLVMAERSAEMGAEIDYSLFDDFAGSTAHGVTSRSLPAGPGFHFSEAH